MTRSLGGPRSRSVAVVVSSTTILVVPFSCSLHMHSNSIEANALRVVVLKFPVTAKSLECLDVQTLWWPYVGHRRRSRSMAGPISKKCTSTTSCLPQTSGLITIAD